MIPNRAALFAACLLVTGGMGGAPARTQAQLPSAIAYEQATFPLTAEGKTAAAVVELAGGYAVDLSITFEEVVGLHARALDLSARTVAPSDAALLARLPGGTLAGVPAALPVVLQIEPAPDSALSFSGVVTVSLHTHNLHFDPAAPLGVYAASAGGRFRDITRSVGMGSYRVDGSGGGFSEFLIAFDGRPIETIIDEKFAALAALLSEHEASIEAEVFARLRRQLDDASALYVSGVTRGAIGALTGFERHVHAHSGRAIPDTWSALGGPPNVAGLLRAAAETLQFSLTVKASRSGND